MLRFLQLQLENGYVNAGLSDDDTRIFTLAKVEYQIPSRLSAMAVSNNILFMAMETMHLLRIDLDKAHEVEGMPGEKDTFYFAFKFLGQTWHSVMNA